MKSKRLFAAILCAITLLTGCSEAPSGTNSEQSSSVSVASYSEESSSSTESSSNETESSSYSSSSTTSSRQSTINSSSIIDEDTHDPRTIRLYPEIESDDATTFGFTSEENGSKVPLNKYNKMVIYESSSSEELGVIVAEKVIDENSWHYYDYLIRVPKSPYTKYYRMQLVGENIKSQLSNAVEIKGSDGSGLGSSSIARYTHTFTAPSYLTVIPDYSEALEEIERGVEPDSFSISVEFTCPGCGKSRTIDVWMAAFPYSKDGTMSFSVKCLWANCPYNKSKNTLRTTIKSHAVRIS